MQPSCHRYIQYGQWATINNANETYPCVTGCATSSLISFQVCVHATELIRLAGVHEFIEERGIGAINLIRRFAEQASLDSRFNYRLPITSPRAFTFSFVLFHTLYEFYHFFFFFFPPLFLPFFSTTATVKLEFCFGEWRPFDEGGRKEKGILRKWKTRLIFYYGDRMIVCYKNCICTRLHGYITQ